ncbi:MAG: hypothetical protein JXQ68_07775 [Campylobacterales bacterium]|nr:hypothetical protein [Campylobacterales bacterium]
MDEIKGLADIKPYLDIEDHSIYLFSGIVALVALVVIVLLWIGISKFLEYKRANKDKFYLEKIKNIDTTNAKQAAYEVTYFGRLITKDQRSSEIYDQLVEILGRYKYKKDVPSFDQQSIALYNLFVQVLNESI